IEGDECSTESSIAVSEPREAEEPVRARRHEINDQTGEKQWLPRQEERGDREPDRRNDEKVGQPSHGNKLDVALEPPKRGKSGPKQHQGHQEQNQWIDPCSESDDDICSKSAQERSPGDSGENKGRQ